LLSFLAFIFVLSVLIVVHEFGHFIVARRSGVRVERFSIGFGPKIAGVKKGETEYVLCLIPLGGYVKMAGESIEDKLTGAKWEFLSQPIGKRFNIVAAGPVLNYILAFFVFGLIFVIGAPTLGTKVGGLLEGYPAEKAGIKVGDLIVAVDGKPVKYWDEMTDIVHKKFDEKILLTVERNNRPREIRLVTRTKEAENIFGQKIRIALMGIEPSEELMTLRYGPVRSFYEGGKKLLILTGFTYKALWLMATGGISPKEVTGPIGIYVLTGKAAQLGFVYLLNILAVISFNLAIFNLLPLPILDGGHIFFLGIEKLRKRPLSPRVQEVITQVGVTFIIFLVLMVSYNDVIKFGVFDKIKDFFSR